jgi:4a-hydroxytetrahydrobiopterin dehydratase
MKQMTKLTDKEVQAALASLPGWSVKDGALYCEYSFPDFVDADAFLTRAGKAVPTWDLHPKAFQNWHRVIVQLKTQEAGEVTLQDLEVAGILESLSQRFP